MSDAITKIADSLVNHEDRIANLERQESPPPVTAIVTSVTASSPLSSSGGTTPNITHNNSGVTAATYTYATVNINATGHITSASSGIAPVTSVGASAPLSSSGGTTPTISHNVSGVGATATYAYPTSVTVESYGHVSAITAGSQPVTSASAPLTVTTGNMTLAITTTNNGGAVALQTSGAPVAQTGYASLSNSGQNVLTIAATSSVVGVTVTSQTGNAIQGTSSSSGGGVAGTSSSGAGVTGTSTSGAGVIATSNSSTGLSASSGSGVGILASSTSNYGISVDKINVTTSRSFGGILRGNYVSAFPGSPATGEHIIHTDLLYSEWYYDGSAWRQLTVPSKSTNFTMTDTPPTGMRVYREDLDIMCAYDGTRWRSPQQRLSFTYQPALAALPLSATTAVVGQISAGDADYGIYAEYFVVRYSVNTTLDNTNKWTLDFTRQYDNGAAVTNAAMGSSYDVYQGGRLPNRNYKAKITVNTAYALTDIDNMFYAATKVASPGTMSISGAVLVFRQIIT